MVSKLKVMKGGKAGEVGKMRVRAVAKVMGNERNKSRGTDEGKVDKVRGSRGIEGRGSE